jgi:hypothetical protein
VLHLVTTSLDARIRRAITGKLLVEITYKGRSRVAEPHDFGCINGVDRLLIYQLRSNTGTQGKESVGWRLLDVPKIEALTVLDATFNGSRGGPDQAHHAWDALYLRVE